MQAILPIALRVSMLSLAQSRVVRVVSDICFFFKGLCAKVLDLDELDKMESQIAFNYANLGRPVHYRWMYIVERYFEGVETLFNLPSINDEHVLEKEMYILNSGGHNLGNVEIIELDHKSLAQAHRYVLLNHSKLQSLRVLKWQLSSRATQQLSSGNSFALTVAKCSSSRIFIGGFLASSTLLVLTSAHSAALINLIIGLDKILSDDSSCSENEELLLWRSLVLLSILWEGLLGVKDWYQEIIMANPFPNHGVNLPDDEQVQPELIPALHGFAPAVLDIPNNNNGLIEEEPEEDLEIEEEEEEEEEEMDIADEMDDPEITDPYKIEEGELLPPPADSNTSSDSEHKVGAKYEDGDKATVGTITRAPYSVPPFSGTIYVGSESSRKVFTHGPIRKDVDMLHRKVKGLA
nr:hypothetical protein [Tanacetum cinerariifolium]